MGLEFEGCYTLILVGAFVITGTWCLLVVGLCWICTRPWSGGLCVALSLLGETAIETEEPVSVVVWAIFSCVAAYIWFRWGKHIVNEVPGPDPEKKKLIPT